MSEYKDMKIVRTMCTNVTTAIRAMEKSEQTIEQKMKELQGTKGAIKNKRMNLHRHGKDKKTRVRPQITPWIVLRIQPDR